MKKSFFSTNLIFYGYPGFRFICLFILLFSSFHISASAQLADTPWPMFMHDPRHTGQSTLRGPQKDTISWQYQMKSEIEASPVLGADGTVYVCDVNGKLYAIARDGTRKWTFSTGGEGYATAALGSNGTIYMGTDRYFYAVKDKGSYAERVWEYTISGSIYSSPVINSQDGTIYFGSDDTYLYALNAQDGAEKWKSELDEEIWGSPVLNKNNDTLYIGTIGGKLHAVNTTDGTVNWSYDTGDIIIGSPSLDEENDRIYFGTTEGRVFALDTTSPDNVRTYPSDTSTLGEIAATPAIDTATDANAVYVGSDDGNLYALHKTDCSLKWKYTTGGAINSSPAIDNKGNIYFGSEDKNIYSLNREGTLRWKYSTQGEVNSSPAIGSGGIAYVGSSDGNLYAIGSRTSAVIAADFTASPTTGNVPLTVQFTDTSAGSITSWLWDFGDNSGTSSSQNPTHTYTQSGDFTVSLEVKGTDWTTDTKVSENYISVRNESGIHLTDISDITFGDAITISGQISGANQVPVSLLEQVLITLTFTINYEEKEDKTLTETVTSSLDGDFTFSYTPPEGGSWSVVASWEGNDYYGSAESDPVSFMVNPAEISELTVEPSFNTVLFGEEIDVTGMITLTPDNATTRNKFLEATILCSSAEYDVLIEGTSTLSGDQLQYTFPHVKLPAAGTWYLTVSFGGDENFYGTTSAEIAVDVREVEKEVTGYAILVEGRTETKSSLDSYNLTTNYIYKKLIDCGFTEENIYYFNDNNSQSGVVVDETPSSKGILDAVTTWAHEKINKSPAPLYLVLVGPAKKEKFLLYSENNKNYDTISADDLAGAIDDLESQQGSGELEEPIIVILGTNYSGSFISKLSRSNSNRIIITSSDAEEVAFKGPLPPDEKTRHGDYFVWNFFKYASMNLSLKKCYEKSVDKIAEFTEIENDDDQENETISGRYFDDSAQHPLFDDNGDGDGAYGVLSSQSGKDGGRSVDVFLGKETAAAQLELTEITDMVTLEAGDSSPTLFARVNDTEKIDEAWIEIASPKYRLPKTGTATEHQVINLPGFSYDEFDAETKKYLWSDFRGDKNLQNFKTPGEYEIFYFAREKDTGEITPFMESDVLRKKENAEPPGTFGYISPYDGQDTAIGLMFDWGDAKNAKTYTFQISEYRDFQPIKYEKTGLTDSTIIVDKTAGLRDGVTYYWTVMAINDGGITYMDISAGTSTGAFAQRTTSNHPANKNTSPVKTSTSFTPKLANGYPGFIKGYIFDGETNVKLSGATVSVQGVKGSYSTTESGAYFLQLLSGTYKISVQASGYETVTKTIRIDALNTTTENIGLTVVTRPASISGKIKDKKERKPVKDVIVTVKKKSFIKTVKTDNAGNYSVADLEPGKYELTAKKNGYKGYTKTLRIKAGQDKILNISIVKRK